MQILELLLEEPGLTHNEIVRKLGRGNRNRALKAINNLVKQRYIREEVRGRRRLCFLTEKGKRKLMNESLKRVNEGLKIAKKLSTTLLSEKSKLEEWRKASSEALLNARITEDMPLEERIRKVEEEAKRTFGLLTEAYKNFHKLMVQVFVWKQNAGYTPDPMKFFIGFHKYGGIYFVPAALLKEQEWREDIL